MSNFHVLEEEIGVSSKNEIKKALKKLREIQVLKEKRDLSDCELDKLSKESYWENILNPIPTEKKETKRKASTQKDIKLAKKKYERQVRKTEYERLEAIEKEKRHKEKEERQKQRQEQEKQRQEQEKQRKEQEKQNERKEKQQEKEKGRRKEFTDMELEKEWQQYLQKNEENIDKTFRILSLKYHPDKNVRNISWSQEKQKQLGLLRDFHHSLQPCQ